MSERPWTEQARELGKNGLRTLALVWSVHRGLTVSMFSLSVLSGILPAAIAFVGKQIVDGVVAIFVESAERNPTMVVVWVLVELVLVAIQRAAYRGEWLCDSLLRTQLGQRVNERILQKALTLSLPDFESSA